MLVSLPVDGAVIERVAAREGWKNDFIAVGTPGVQPAFHCYRMWIENRVLFEFVPQSMIHEYETYMQFGRLDETAAQGSRRGLAWGGRCRPPVH